MINTTMTALAGFYAPAPGNANSTNTQTAKEDSKTGATVAATGASSGGQKSGSTPPTPTRSGSASGHTAARESASAAPAPARDGEAETSEDMQRTDAVAAQTRMKTDLLIKSMSPQSQSAGRVSEAPSETPQALAVSAYMDNAGNGGDSKAA